MGMNTGTDDGQISRALEFFAGGSHQERTEGCLICNEDFKLNFL